MIGARREIDMDDKKEKQGTPATDVIYVLVERLFKVIIIMCLTWFVTVALFIARDWYIVSNFNVLSTEVSTEISSEGEGNANYIEGTGDINNGTNQGDKEADEDREKQGEENY